MRSPTGALWISGSSILTRPMIGTEVGSTHQSPARDPDCLLADHGTERTGAIAIADKKKSDGTPRVLSAWQRGGGYLALLGDAVITTVPDSSHRLKSFRGPTRWNVTRDAEDALASLRQGPAGIEIDSTIFRRRFIQMALDNLSRALIIGCLLVMVVLGAFLFEWRTALVSLVAIPLSLVAGGSCSICAERPSIRNSGGVP